MDSIQATTELNRLLATLTRTYSIMRVLCIMSWPANFMFMVMAPIFMKENGINLSSIFLLNVVVITVSFITSTVLSAVSDKTRSRKKFMAAAYGLRTASLLFLVIGSELPVFIIHYVLISLLNPLSFETPLIYELAESIESLKAKRERRVEKVDVQTRFYLRYRMLGSLSWAFSAPFIGWGITALNQFSIPGVPLLDLMGFRFFFLVALLLYLVITVVFVVTYKEGIYRQVREVLACLTSDGCPSQGIEHGDGTVEVMQPERPVARGEGQWLSKISRLAPGFTLLLVVMFLFTGGSNLFQTAYPVFLNEFSRGNLVLVGVSFFCSAAPEAPLFMISHALMKRKGYESALGVSFIMEISRTFFTILVIPLDVAWFVVPLQLMHSFSFRWAALTHGISTELTPNTKATGMNLTLIVEKVGGLVGSGFGAWIAMLVEGGDQFTIIFVAALVFFLSTTIIFLSGTAILKRKQRVVRSMQGEEGLDGK